MPTATVNNPDANFNAKRTVNRRTGKHERPSKSKTVNIIGLRAPIPVSVPETLSVRYKKKRLPRGRTSAPRRSALTIPLRS